MLHFGKVLTLTACLICLAASAGDKPTPAQAAFERLKGLAGEWRGRIGDREKGPAATVLFRTTAADHTVMETLFPGTAHEMVTMYHLEEGKLVLTHYCAAGNQPRMALTKKSTAGRARLQFHRRREPLRAPRWPHARRADPIRKPGCPRDRMGLFPGRQKVGHQEVFPEAEKLTLLLIESRAPHA